MTFLSPLSSRQCLVGRRYADKGACLGDLAAVAGAALSLDRRVILEALVRRETLGSTGLGDGIALPHARLPSLAAPFVLIANLKDAIPFDAVDGRPVDLVCLLLLPAEPAGSHLALLSRCARILRDKQRSGAIRRARSSEALAAIVNAEDDAR